MKIRNFGSSETVIFSDTEEARLRIYFFVSNSVCVARWKSLPAFAYNVIDSKREWNSSRGQRLIRHTGTFQRRTCDRFIYGGYIWRERLALFLFLPFRMALTMAIPGFVPNLRAFQEMRQLMCSEWSVERCFFQRQFVYFFLVTTESFSGSKKFSNFITTWK